jgi:hypothetical protein
LRDRLKRNFEVWPKAMANEACDEGRGSEVELRGRTGRSSQRSGKKAPGKLLITGEWKQNEKCWIVTGDDGSRRAEK